MSYIHGRTNGREGILFADSILTFADSEGDPTDLRRQCLKVHVFGHNHCIGVAGIFSIGVDSSGEGAKVLKMAGPL